MEQRRTATELAPRQPGFRGRTRPTPGCPPCHLADELFRPGTFQSDDELHEFLADLNQSRRPDVG